MTLVPALKGSGGVTPRLPIPTRKTPRGAISTTCSASRLPTLATRPCGVPMQLVC